MCPLLLLYPLFLSQGKETWLINCYALQTLTWDKMKLCSHTLQPPGVIQFRVVLVLVGFA